MIAMCRCAQTHNKSTLTSTRTAWSKSRSYNVNGSNNEKQPYQWVSAIGVDVCVQSGVNLRLWYVAPSSVLYLPLVSTSNSLGFCNRRCRTCPEWCEGLVRKLGSFLPVRKR